MALGVSRPLHHLRASSLYPIAARFRHNSSDHKGYSAPRSMPTRRGGSSLPSATMMNRATIHYFLLIRCIGPTHRLLKGVTNGC